MRPIVLAVASLGLVAACSPGEPAADEAAAPAATEQAEPAADDHSADGHDMAAMDDTMAAADTADDAEATVTPDNYTFHTYPKKIEIVRLPLDGGVWSGNGYADSELFKLLDSKDDTLPDGTAVHAVRFEMLASGNGKAIFEKRASDNPDDPVLEVRTVNFMIH